MERPVVRGRALRGQGTPRTRVARPCRSRPERCPMSTEAVATTEPDLADIRADDALLDALGGRDPQPAAEELHDDVAALLLAWCRTTDTDPVEPLVSTRRAMWLIRRVRWTARATRFL